MKVLFIIHNQSGTGPYPKVVEQAEALTRTGARCTVMCTSRSSRWRLTTRREGSVDIIEAPDLLWGRLRQGLDLWNALRRCAWLATRRFDVVHAIDCRPVVLVPCLFARSRGMPLVLSWWDYFGGGGTALERSGAGYAATLGRFEGWLERAGRRFATRATVISRFLESRLQELSFPPERTTLMRIGCDTTRFPLITKSNARAALGLPADAVILCYVGALMPADRDLLVAALRHLKEAGVVLLPVLVGTPALHAGDVEDLGIRMISRQPLETVHRYISAADLCLLPLRLSVANAARWPSKTADYLNAGRPVVATPVGDLKELFTSNRLGYLAESDHPEAFADAIRRAVEAKDEWENVASSCRRFAVEELDVATLARRLNAIYSDAIQH